MPVIAMGGSAGSLDPLRTILHALPGGFPAAVLVVVHVSRDSPGMLPELLSRPGGLPAVHPRPGERLQAGRVYVAPPDYHMLLRSTDGLPARAGAPLTLALTRGPRENRHRPAIDPMFRSVGRLLGSAAIGVILSGLMEDGASGLFYIRARGGHTLVQDPATASVREMPESAIREADPEFVLPPDAIAAKLMDLVRPRHSADNHGVPDPVEIPSGFTCPECGGMLAEAAAGDPAARAVAAFRCRVGHTYGWESLASEYTAGTENALWVAMRTLREKAALARRLAGRAPAASLESAYSVQAREAEEQADRIRDMIESLSDLLFPARAELATPQMGGDGPSRL